MQTPFTHAIYIGERDHLLIKPSSIRNSLPILLTTTDHPI